MNMNIRTEKIYRGEVIFLIKIFNFYQKNNSPR